MANDYTYVFEHIPLVDEDGTTLEYDVVPNTVNGYKSSIYQDKNDQTSFTITNRKDTEKNKSVYYKKTSVNTKEEIEIPSYDGGFANEAAEAEKAAVSIKSTEDSTARKIVAGIIASIVAVLISAIVAIIKNREDDDDDDDDDYDE